MSLDPNDPNDDNASTQAVDMSKVHEGIQKLQQAGQLGPVPGLPQLGGQQPAPAAKQPAQKPTKATDPNDPGPRPSGIMAVVGGALVFLSFFFGWFSGAPLVKNNDIIKEISKDYRAQDLFSDDFDIEQVPEEQRKGLEVALDVFEALDFDDYVLALAETESRDDQIEVAKNYRISPLGAARALMTIDLNVKDIVQETDDSRFKEVLAASRVIWLSIFLLWLSGLIAVAHSASRRFRPLSSLQIAWNGVFGLLLLALALGTIGIDETEKVLGEAIPLFSGVGRFILAGGALTLWVSAFAGLDNRNWWKAPLIGLGVLVFIAVVVGGPAFMALA